MTCDEYLATLVTASLDEIDAMGEHAARCPDCGRVARLVTAQERSRVAAFDALHPPTPIHVATETIPATSRERRRDWLYSMATALALAVLVSVGASRIQRMHFGGRAGAPLVTEAFLVRCLSPGQAMALMAPHVGREGTVATSPQAGGVLTVRTTAERMRDVRALLARYESAGSGGCSRP